MAELGQQQKKSRSVFGTIRRGFMPKNHHQESSSTILEGNSLGETTADERPGHRRDGGGSGRRRRDKNGERIDKGARTGGTGDHAPSNHLQVIRSEKSESASIIQRGVTTGNNAQKKNSGVSVKRSKSQRSKTSLVRVNCAKRRIDSPTRKLNSKLTHALLQARQSNKFYQQELSSIQATNLQEIYQLQSENEILSCEHVELRQKVEQWKRRCRELKDKNGPYVKLQAMKKENQALTVDLEVCKSVIFRLNAELMTYQEKLRNFNNAESNNEQLSDRNQTFVVYDKNDNSNTFSSSLPEIMGLLRAYDQVIQDKNGTIEEHENTLHKFRAECKEIITENQDLHKQISNKQEMGMVSIEEWQVLHSNAIVVLEENDVLHEKVALLNQKEDIMMKSHTDKVNKLKARISTLEEERAILKEAITKSENQSKHLLEQQARLSEILEKRIPIDQHEASVQQCKVLFEELKTNYESERSALLEQLEMAEKEKNRLSREVSELQASKTRLQSNLSTCEESLASNTQQFQEVFKTMLDATKTKDAATIALEETRKLSQRILQDKENSDRLLHDQRILNEKLVHLREKETGLVYELKRKIQEMENVNSQEVEKYLLRIQELERAKEQLGVDQYQKLSYLETLVNEKSRRIEHLETEKKQLQVDVETAWKSNTSTMKEIAHSR